MYCSSITPMLLRNGSKHSHANNTPATKRTNRSHPTVPEQVASNFVTLYPKHLAGFHTADKRSRTGVLVIVNTPLFRSRTLYLHFQAPKEENTKVNLAFQRFRVHFHNPLVLYTKQYDKLTDPNFFCVRGFVCSNRFPQCEQRGRTL